MQTSKKILISVTGVVVACFVTSLVMLRKDSLAVIEQEKLQMKLSTIPVEAFHSLEINGNWDVQIRQGRIQKVELSYDKDRNYMPQITEKDSLLSLSIEGDTTVLVIAKITTPRLHLLQLGQRAKVSLEKFKLDSIRIEVEDSHLVNAENEFVYVDYKTIGNSRIEFIDDPFQ